MEQTDGDTRILRLYPEVHMRRRRHGITGGDESDAHVHRVVDDVLALLDLSSVQDLDLLADDLLQILGLGADQERCVEFRVDLPHRHHVQGVRPY